MDKGKRRMVAGWIDKAWKQLETAEEHLESHIRHSESIEASQECIELSVKSILSLLDIEYPPHHWWEGKQFSNIATQIQERRLLNRLEAQDQPIYLPRLLLLAKLWAQFYLTAKYGFEEGDLAPAKDLFDKKEASLALQHARECYWAASQLMNLSEDKLAAIVS
jgi:hypothetical protein